MGEFFQFVGVRQVVWVNGKLVLILISWDKENKQIHISASDNCGQSLFSEKKSESSKRKKVKPKDARPMACVSKNIAQISFSALSDVRCTCGSENAV